MNYYHTPVKVMASTVIRTLGRRGYQHITPSKIFSILLPIQVYGAGLNLLVDLLNIIPIISLAGSG